ncbi:hypothetical protein BH10PSE3_BH10PSE3_17120 [soil metagenome]
MRSLKIYTVLVAALFVVLLVAAATILVHQAEESGRQQMRVQMLDTARALTQVVDARLDGYEQLLVALAASQAMERRDFAALDGQARRALVDPNAWVILADRQGNQMINTRLPRGAKLPRGPLPEAAWRELDTGKARRCNLVRGLVEPHVLCVDWPIMEGGQARYTLSVIFQPALLQRVIDSQRVPNGRFATIIDREGTVIWRNAAPERFVAKKATPDLRRRSNMKLTRGKAVRSAAVSVEVCPSGPFRTML